MQVHAEHGTRGVPVSPAAGSDIASMARDRRTVPLAITAAVVGAALVIFAVTLSLRGTPAARTPRPAAPPADVSDADTGGLVRMDRALGWVDGLAADLILPSDVTSRLGTQDPTMAKAVLAAWSDLDSSGSSIRLHRALSWVDGLASGLILPSDVTSRLRIQDPSMAKAVLAAWSDLKAVATSEDSSNAVDMRGDYGLRHPGFIAPGTSGRAEIDWTGDYALRHPGFGLSG